MILARYGIFFSGCVLRELLMPGYAKQKEYSDRRVLYIRLKFRLFGICREAQFLEPLRCKSKGKSIQAYHNSLVFVGNLRPDFLTVTQMADDTRSGCSRIADSSRMEVRVATCYWVHTLINCIEIPVAAVEAVNRTVQQSMERFIGLTDIICTRKSVLMD